MTYELQVSPTKRINLMKLPLALAKVAPLSLLYTSLADHERMGALADVLTGRPQRASSVWWEIFGYETYRAVDGKFTYDMGDNFAYNGGWH